jgi:2-oxoisovalerate dehydrogenase E2 component (dihydrolipoyl transacylase)
MARYVFRLPDIGEGVAEAEIADWHVKVGDHIAEGEPLADVLTDKATVEMTAPVAGVVTAAHGAVGDKLAVGAPLAEFEIEAPEETFEAPDAAAEAAEPALVRPAPEKPRQAAEPLAAPAVRARAREEGVELSAVAGTGPDGRITAADLDRHLAGLNAAQEPGVEAVRIVGLRRKIAEHLAEAARRIPHFTYVEEIDVTELEALRARLNAQRGERASLTLLPFFMRALVRALARHPQINARYDDDAGVLYRHAAVHVGIATQTADGLIVPVVRNVERRDLWGCAEAVAGAAASARDGTASREALYGSTITLSSLGALGGVVSTPVINRPEVAILAPNRIVERPMARDGAVVLRKMMNLSSSFDHRIVDGYDAAAFIQRLRSILEQPEGLDAPLA